MGALGHLEDLITKSVGVGDWVAGKASGAMARHLALRMWRRAVSRRAFATTAKIDEWQRIFNTRHVALGHELCDKYASNALALRLTDEGREVSFGELEDVSRRLATVLAELGVGKGDRVACMLPKSCEIMTTVLAVARLGACYVPLFTAFGPDAAEYRVEASGAKVVVTDSEHRQKLNGIFGGVKFVTVGGASSIDVNYDDAVRATSPLPDCSHAEVSGDDLLALVFTSGTTGRAKGVEVPVKALSAFKAYMHYGLHVTEDCTFWNVADPGWAYGLYYNMYGTLACRIPAIMQRSGFNPASAKKVLEDYAVTNVAAAPVWYRALRANLEPQSNWLPSLTRASSAGEPLNPSVSEWLQRVSANSVPIRDHYGQTEGGMIAINHWHPDHATSELHPGSFGTSMVGFSAAIVSQLDEELASASGQKVAPLPVGACGALAIDVDEAASPLFWFRAYFNNTEKTAKRFVDGTDGRRYYITGDVAERDDEGFFRFSSRDDDVITSSAYRIGPFDVESAIMQHPAVAEVAVIGVPDPEGLRGEIVKACVVLKEGESERESLYDEFKDLVRRVGAHMVPKQVQYVQELPKTPSGKTQRFLLRQRHVNAGQGGR